MTIRFHRANAHLMQSLTCLLAFFAGVTGVQAQQAADPDVKRVAATPGALSRNLVVEKSRDASESPLRVKMPQLPSTEGIQPKQAKPSVNTETWTDTNRLSAQLPSLIMMAGMTFLPAALLMTTSFVRIQITLSLLRQALGSPSIPGNQVIVVLSLLLTVLIMKPVGNQVYDRSVTPYLEGRMSQTDAVRSGVEPVRKFMVAQILNTGHVAYLEELAAYARDQEPGKKTTEKPVESAPKTDEMPLHVVAPAFLLSELTTALLIGFAVYLPFLIVDLVVATILAAMGLWMMPPSLVSTPAKLILFVLADGWMLTAGALMNGFVVS